MKVLTKKTTSPLPTNTPSSTASSDINFNFLISKQFIPAATPSTENYEVILVMDRVCDLLNHQSCYRLASCLGVANVWSVLNELPAKNRQADLSSFALSDLYLNLRYFRSPSSCLSALRAEGYETWVSTLSPDAIPLTLDSLAHANTITTQFFSSTQKSSIPLRTALFDLLPTIPRKLAIVIGREADGVSDLLIKNASKCVYLPMFGFAESYNASVAGALLLHRIITLIEFQKNISLKCAQFGLESPYRTADNIMKFIQNNSSQKSTLLNKNQLLQRWKMTHDQISKLLEQHHASHPPTLTPTIISRASWALHHGACSIPDTDEHRALLQSVGLTEESITPLCDQLYADQASLLIFLDHHYGGHTDDIPFVTPILVPPNNVISRQVQLSENNDLDIPHDQLSKQIEIDNPSQAKHSLSLKKEILKTKQKEKISIFQQQSDPAVSVGGKFTKTAATKQVACCLLYGQKSSLKPTLLHITPNSSDFNQMTANDTNPSLSTNISEISSNTDVSEYFTSLQQQHHQSAFFTQSHPPSTPIKRTVSYMDIGYSSISSQHITTSTITNTVDIDQYKADGSKFLTPTLPNMILRWLILNELRDALLHAPLPVDIPLYKSTVNPNSPMNTPHVHTTTSDKQIPLTSHQRDILEKSLLHKQQFCAVSNNTNQLLTKYLLLLKQLQALFLSLEQDCTVYAPLLSRIQSEYHIHSPLRHKLNVNNIKHSTNNVDQMKYQQFSSNVKLGEMTALFMMFSAYYSTDTRWFVGLQSSSTSHIIDYITPLRAFMGKLQMLVVKYDNPDEYHQYAVNLEQYNNYHLYIELLRCSQEYDIYDQKMMEIQEKQQKTGKKQQPLNYKVQSQWSRDEIKHKLVDLDTYFHRISCNVAQNTEIIGASTDTLMDDTCAEQKIQSNKNKKALSLPIPPPHVINVPDMVASDLRKQFGKNIKYGFDEKKDITQLISTMLKLSNNDHFLQDLTPLLSKYYTNIISKLSKFGNIDNYLTQEQKFKQIDQAALSNTIWSKYRYNRFINDNLYLGAYTKDISHRLIDLIPLPLRGAPAASIPLQVTMREFFTQGFITAVTPAHARWVLNLMNNTPVYQNYQHYLFCQYDDLDEVNHDNNCTLPSKQSRYQSNCDANGTCYHCLLSILPVCNDCSYQILINIIKTVFCDECSSNPHNPQTHYIQRIIFLIKQVIYTILHNNNDDNIKQIQALKQQNTNTFDNTDNNPFVHSIFGGESLFKAPYTQHQLSTLLSNDTFIHTIAQQLLSRIFSTIQLSPNNQPKSAYNTDNTYTTQLFSLCLSSAPFKTPNLLKNNSHITTHPKQLIQSPSTNTLLSHFPSQIAAQLQINPSPMAYTASYAMLTNLQRWLLFFTQHLLPPSNSPHNNNIYNSILHNENDILTQRTDTSLSYSPYNTHISQFIDDLIVNPSQPQAFNWGQFNQNSNDHTEITISLNDVITTCRDAMLHLIDHNQNKYRLDDSFAQLYFFESQYSIFIRSLQDIIIQCLVTKYIIPDANNNLSSEIFNDTNVKKKKSKVSFDVALSQHPNLQLIVYIAMDLFIRAMFLDHLTICLKPSILKQLHSNTYTYNNEEHVITTFTSKLFDSHIIKQLFFKPPHEDNNFKNGEFSLTHVAYAARIIDTASFTTWRNELNEYSFGCEESNIVNNNVGNKPILVTIPHNMRPYTNEKFSTTLLFSPHNLNLISAPPKVTTFLSNTMERA